MRIARLLVLAILAVFLATPRANAIDEGQTRPRLSSASITSPNTTVNLIPFTSGSGNLKGIHCIFAATAANRIQPVNIYVDGGSAQALNIESTSFPQESDGSGRTSTGFIPMNVRFGSSLQIQLTRASSPNAVFDVTCVASWALD
ncbi:MAG TPA: hypothetical protein VLB76_01925 [Thermoanaerobaculia bacterium]|jgi:hypothetical protein|nr:hypothetical protein [Thermoanaerobaculia bacterium]